MEEHLPKEEIKEEVKTEEKKSASKLFRNKKFKILLIIVTPILLLLVVWVIYVLNFYRTYGDILNDPRRDGSIAPKSEDLLNPLDFQASILFSTLYIEAEPGDTITNDVEIMTFSDGAVNGGTVVINYDRNLIEDIKVTPAAGSTGFLPSATFSDVKYNPDNVMFSFQTTQGTTPATGRGRVAEVEFTIRDDAFADVKLMVDLNRSSLYSDAQGASAPLRTGSSDLVVKLIGSE
jgi:hypothetical protein